MPIMRNWDYFAAIHRNNIRDVRIQFAVPDGGEADHNDIHQHKIGQKVFYTVLQGDVNRTHSVPATVVGVRFSAFSVRYDLAIEIGDTGCMAVLKQICPDSVSKTPFGETPEPAPVEEVQKELSTPLKLAPSEPLLDEAPAGWKPFPTTYFNQQATDQKPELGVLMVTSLKVSGSFDDAEFCKFQIGDAVKIDLEDEAGTLIYGYVYAINVSQHFSFDIAVPTPHGVYTILRDIASDDLFIVNQIPKGK